MAIPSHWVIYSSRRQGLLSKLLPKAILKQLGSENSRFYLTDFNHIASTRMVRMMGFEPIRVYSLPPQSSVSTIPPHPQIKFNYKPILIEKPNSVQSLTLVGVAADIFCVAGILVYFSPTGIPYSDYLYLNDILNFVYKAWH